MIPSQYTCDGRNVSPPLSWSGVPADAKNLALICDDPDAPAGVWVHWVVYDLPASAKGLPEAVPLRDEISGGGRQGKNDFRKTGYGGPCPPGGTHRYVFTLSALDRPVGLPAGATKAQLLSAMRGHVLAEGKLTGKYSRR
ncbi:MAG TPA: YbhB/YbcL family Raf kinase inhibitor-like protein [Thermoanaerobaculia bacterium]|nr:YbhB/YbcL family Raf kinase inhibitor-like protein [Thermoanaerobaculia bacterium]